MKRELKNIFWVFAVLFLGFFVPATFFDLSLNFFRFFENNSFVYMVNRLNLSSLTETNEDVIELVFVGDIMLSRGVESSINRNNSGNFSYLFSDVDFIKKADIAFGNLEGPVSSTGRDLGNLYSFRFKPDALEALLGAGFDIFSVANNHAADWGRDAFEENIFRLKNEGVYPVGGGVNRNDALSVKIVEKSGVKVGFLGFSDVGPNWFEVKEDEAGILIVRDDFHSLVKKASVGVDVLVVSLHFGEEYEKNSNDRQKMLARLAIDSGAKIVAGHHPHVIQEVEKYKKGVIAYSLGNFIFDQNFSEETMEGLVLRIYLKGSEIIAVQENKVKLNNFYQPKLVDKK